MSRLFSAICLSTLIACPALAQDQTKAGPAVVRPAIDRATPIARAPGADEPNWAQIQRQLHARAGNAVANGADPGEIRQKLQDYKQMLRRRWNASN